MVKPMIMNLTYPAGLAVNFSIDAKNGMIVDRELNRRLAKIRGVRSLAADRARIRHYMYSQLAFEHAQQAFQSEPVRAEPSKKTELVPFAAGYVYPPTEVRRAARYIGLYSDDVPEVLCLAVEAVEMIKRSRSRESAPVPTNG